MVGPTCGIFRSASCFSLRCFLERFLRKEKGKDSKSRNFTWFRPFLMGEFFFWGCKQSFFCFKSVIAPWREEIEPTLLGMSLTTLGEVPRSFFRFSRLAVAIIRTSSFFDCVVRKLTVDQNGGSVCSTFFFLARKLKNELVRNYRNCDNREAGKWLGYLSASSQTHSEKSRLDFLSLQGIN